MTNQQTYFIHTHLHLPNNAIAEMLGLSEAQIRNHLYRSNIVRSKEQVRQICSSVNSKRTGENNPNWKGGISKDNYHYRKIQIERYPERIKARQKVHYYKKVGQLIPGSCEHCGTNEGITAHHPDYSQPLLVNWLCVNCHRELHRKDREQIGERLNKPSQVVKQLNLFENYNFYS